MIALEVSLTNADRCIAALRAIGERVISTMVKTARRGVWRHAVPQTRTAIAQDSGIGRSIWGQDQSGLESQGLVKQGRLVIGPTEGQTTLLLRGIPALLENGGRIRAHTIRNGFGRKGKRLQNPGMTLRAHGFGKMALDHGAAEIQGEVDSAVGEMLRRNGF